MALLRAGAAFGIESFLILDMAVVHQLLRFHGVLFSAYFEYALLAISVALALRAVLRRNWSLKDDSIRSGMLIGFGGTLFLDVFLVDEILELHSVNYPVSLNIGIGFIGLVLVVVGVYMWQTKQVSSQVK